MATTKKHEIGEWDTFHHNGPFKTRVLYDTFPDEMPASSSFSFAVYTSTAAEIRRLLKEVTDRNEGFRPYGSGWSLSSIAHHHENMHYNARLDMKKNIEAADTVANASIPYQNLFFFQCGNVIKQVSGFLAGFSKSLKVSGASNGQTICGAISTGVHGSAFDVGALQDCVVGLNLIIGPDARDVVYLERASQPIASESFIQQIGARIIRDDELFNAAVVGLGAFGFIHGVMIEAEDQFLLNRYVTKLDKATALALADTLDFANTSFKIPGETDATGKALRPYHYKVFINPYKDEQDYVAEVMYKKPYKPGYEDPIPKIKTAIYRDLIVLFTKIAENHKNSIPTLIKFLQGAVLPAADHKTTGTLGETFWDSGYQGPAFACSVGVDCADTSKALKLLTDLAKKEGPVPGLYALRFVKQSKATLAPTQFPVTCMVEIDGLIWKGRENKMITLEQFCTRTIEVLKQAGIPFTIHWGKHADWAYPGLIESMYGDRLATWQQQRNKLLPERSRAVFSSPFLQQTVLKPLA